MLKLRDEFNNCFSRDNRLTKRVQKIAQSIADNPCLSINAACGSFGESKAAYRFFQNEHVDVGTITRIHIERTLNRAQDHDSVLVIQDTTDLIYTQFPSINDIGELHKAKGYDSAVRGLMLHNSLIATESGVPLGVLKQSFFTHEDYRRKRQSESVNSGNSKKFPIEKKQSYRWIEHFKITDETLKQKGVEAIHVADREADIYELIEEVADSDSKFVIRSHPNRRTANGTTRKQTSTIQEQLNSQNVSAEILIQKENKTVSCEVRYAEVELAWPQRLPAMKSKPLSNQEVTVVEVKSKNTKGPKIYWRLLTNLSIEKVEDALRIINIYKQRWMIECFHRILKSGFGAEKARLSKRCRLEKMVSLLSIISWHIFWLYSFSRIIPNARAEVVFDQDAVKILKISAKRLKVSIKGKFTLKKATFIMARLGGFLGRKSDGDPGMQSLWRGWHKLSERLAFMEDMTCG